MTHQETYPSVRRNDMAGEDLLGLINYEQARRIADTAEHLGAMAMRFAQIDRVPRYTPERRENDAEHSFMLGLVATELSQQLYPDLQPGLVSQFAAVHDLVELEAGDVATFDISPAALEAKKHAEEAALQKLLKTLPPFTANLLVRYEQQVEPEARFVRMVDKMMPLIADIHGPGRQVMEEDYDVYFADDLKASEMKMRERFLRMCPEFPELHAARNILANRFEGLFRASE